MSEEKQDINYVTVIIVSLGKAIAMPTERVVGTLADVEQWVKENYDEDEVLEVQIDYPA